MANPNNYALLCVDPGVTTGIAIGLVNCSQPTVASTMRRAHRKGLLDTHELTGEWYQQSWVIARKFYDFMFKANVEKGVVVAKNFRLVMEGFQVRDVGVDLTPVRIQNGVEILVRGGLEGNRPSNLSRLNNEYDHFVRIQSPSEQQFCSDEMLKDWGLWKKSKHERSALKHMAKRIDRILEGDR